MSLRKKLVHGSKVPAAVIWRALGAPVCGPVHLMIALADHFEPAIDPADGHKRVPRSEQERRLEWWGREYPQAVERWRDHDGRPFVHTYFYPAEQYDEGLLEIIAEHCHSGWGETEIHLHHGIPHPDSAENTRLLLTDFRDRLAFRHRCLAAEEGSGQPRYCFVHGNFALANSAGGRWCGVDSEMKVLAETGCYADFTLPTPVPHPAQTAKINSLYECGLPLEQAAPHKKGTDLSAGRTPHIFPLVVEGPLLADFGRSWRALRPQLETGAITQPNPMSLDRLALWKRARIRVAGRPDWLFIKLHCHSMDPTQRDVVVGNPFRKFLEQLVGGAEERKETLHFVTAREMANIILAACDGKDGNPGRYRDYRFKLFRDLPAAAGKSDSLPVSVKG
ncbi:MAG TPA: hypothetical protein VIX14_00500 [Terriglobales bacterium]